MDATSSTSISGKAAPRPPVGRTRRPDSISPSLRSSWMRRVSSGRASFLMWKARAISRRLARPGFSRTNAITCCLVGKGGGVFGRAKKEPFLVPRPFRRPLARLLLHRRFLGSGFLRVRLRLLRGRLLCRGGLLGGRLLRRFGFGLGNGFRLRRRLLGAALRRLLLLLAALGRAARRQQRRRLLEGELVGIDAARQGRADIAPGQIGTEAALMQRDLGLVGGMLADGAQRGGLGLRLGEQRHGAVEADGQHVVVAAEAFEQLAHSYIGSEAADAGGDRLLRLRMEPDLARQRQKLQRLFERNVRGRRAGR